MTNYYTDNWNTYPKERFTKLKNCINFMSKSKNANIATFISAIVGGVATMICAYFMGFM